MFSSVCSPICVQLGFHMCNQICSITALLFWLFGWASLDGSAFGELILDEHILDGPALYGPNLVWPRLDGRTWNGLTLHRYTLNRPTLHGPTLDGSVGWLLCGLTIHWARKNYTVSWQFQTISISNGFHKFSTDYRKINIIEMLYEDAYWWLMLHAAGQKNERTRRVSSFSLTSLGQYQSSVLYLNNVFLLLYTLCDIFLT